MLENSLERINPPPPSKKKKQNKPNTQNLTYHEF